ncbi:aspartyl protease family protein [Paraferrimonas sedimenticola]|uniref:Aspartyl protease n=1 Tax=Paraferrimonas sedimenticola TaxID=375674 RepID=A0AA37VZQ2_9GAMM|nr:aspartyl protease family protein [Paraferrimonas sedimenticola]GLP95860.1 hypothetical protein GCM10007895_11660 [Paraferrimonas sedimenticola]
MQFSRVLKIAAVAMTLLHTQAFAGLGDWVEFNIDNGQIKMPVTIEGVSANAIIDSGAELSGINNAFLAANGLSFDKGPKIKVKGADGSQTQASANGVPVNMFKAAFTVNELVKADMGDASDAVVLGSSFFRDFLLQIDYPNKRIRLLDKKAVNLNKLKNIDMRADRKTGSSIIKVALGGGEETWMLLDTGSQAGVVAKRDTAEENGWTKLPVDSSAVVKNVKVDTFRLPSMTFGPYNLENVLAAIPAQGQSLSNLENSIGNSPSFRGKRVNGLIGYDVLKNYVITMDYSKGRMHIGLPETI